MISAHVEKGEKMTTMDEYIKREDAIDAVLMVYYDTPDIDLSGGKFEAEILNIQASDVEPVKHGRWVCGDYYDVGDVCSECDWDSQMICPSYRYCPNCGAKMDGKRGA